jgi:hypothetical protein
MNPATPPEAAPVPAAAVVQSLLHAWETLHPAASPERAVGLLDAVWPGHGADQWRRLSIGDRDTLLFLLQSSLFGEDLETVAACPACGERLESRFRVGDVCAPPTQWPQPRGSLELRHDGYRVSFRLPCSDDLAALGGDTAAAGQRLLERCVLDAKHGRRPLDASQLPATVREKLGEAMAEHDPVADLRMGITCPACGHAWAAALDIVAYLWDELDDWAQDLLAQVHVLARHYAWSERDILALTPVRRRYYLDLLQS